MTDFASLGIRIDSSQAKKAIDDLQKLESAGEGAEKAVEGVGKAADKAADDLKGASDATKDAGKSIEDYTRKVENLGKSQVAAAAAAKQIELSTKSAAAAQSNFGRGALDAAQVKSASNAIDEQVKKLQLLAATNGMGAREAKLYELALNGASKAQLQAADSAIRLTEGYERGLEIGQRLRVGLVSTAAAAGAFGVAVVVGANRVADSIAKYQDLADKTGETASGIASLQPAADLSGTSIDTVAEASVRLTAALSKTDDESKLVAKGIRALGLNFEEFKKYSPAKQLDEVAKAMAGFENGSEKSAAAVAIFGKSGASLIPFLNDLADGGERQLRLSEDQIKAADDYTKATARLRSEFDGFLQQQVSGIIPALSEVQSLMAQLAKDQASVETVTAILSGTIKAATVVFQTLAVVGSDVGFVFLGVGREIAAITAQLAALMQLDFKGFSAISDAVKEDGQRARKELDAFQKRIMAIGQPQYSDDETLRLAARARAATAQPKGRINVDDLNTDKTKRTKSTAAQEAKAQLALDLEDIRKAQDALSNTIANGEKLLEARRAANLVSEADYWEQKRQFVVENSQVQQQGLEKELARLQQEKLSGKDAIDNARKILDVESKLKKSREDGASALLVMGVKQVDALDKIQVKFEEAAKAAENYVDTIARANRREIDGMGRGSLQREIDARRSQRDDQYQQRQDGFRSQARAGQIGFSDLQSYLAIEEASYKAVLKLDDEYWAARKRNLEDGLLGAQEGLQNFIDQAGNAYERGNRLVSDGLNGFSDSLTSSLMGEDGKWEDLGKSVARQFIKGLVDVNLIKPAAEALQTLIGGPTASGITGSLGGAAGASATAAAQSAVTASATSAATSLAALTTAAASAAAALGGSSISKALGASNLFGSSGGDSLGALISLMGWADGGPTIPGGKYQVAGFVHAGENVWSQKNIADAGGMANVEWWRQNSGLLGRLGKRGFADGGPVMPLPPSASAAAGSGRRASFVFSPVTEIKVDSRADQAAVRLEVQRIVKNNNEQYTRELQRLGVIPQGNR